MLLSPSHCVMRKRDTETTILDLSILNYYWSIDIGSFVDIRGNCSQCLQQLSARDMMI